MLAAPSPADTVLRRWFGFPSLRAPQRRAIDAVLAARDVLVVMPTGGGKSLCYQVPALMLDGLTVVLSPLVSLMKDQVDALLRRAVPAVGIHGGMTRAEQGDALARALTGRAKLLYVAPERLVTGRTLDALRRVRVSLLAVDEAHCISEWGHDFRPAYRGMQAIREPLGWPPAIALTATATPAVRADIEKVCRLSAPVRVVAGFDRPNLRYAVRRVKDRRHRDAAICDVVSRRCGCAVVYAPTRARAERIAQMLRLAGQPALAYHAGQAVAVRREAQESFMRGAVVMVATSAFGMGVDKPDVRLVVHDALPASLESYYQESGRAGRDGCLSECLLLYSRADRRTPEHFIRAASPGRDLVARVYAAAARLAAGDRGPWVDVPAVARRAQAGVPETRGALSILVGAGAVAVEAGAADAIWVRLTATPGRIARALPSGNAHRDLLRALWTVSGGAIASGACVAPTSLPPGLGAVGLREALDRLQAEQFLVWKVPGAGLRVVNPAEGLGAWRVDWDALAARREAAEQRLAAMVRYAEAASCRRRLLLSYFGDPAAGSCAGCDRCPRRTA